MMWTKPELNTRNPLPKGVSGTAMTALTRASRLVFAMLILLGVHGCASTSVSPDAQAEQLATLDGKPVVLKTVPLASYFTGEYDMPVADIRARTKSLAERVAVAAVKRAKLDITGPLTLFLPDWRNLTAEEVTLEVGYPVSGSGQLVPQFQQANKDAFKCLSVTRKAGADNSGAWKKLYMIAAEQGLKVSGENRAVISSTGDGYQTELQLGLR